ncbi:hypothetical protein SHELI_v1c03460 [Spiroplasma helicoides]|uniref:Lipoprotein n=1 Tax=Spiroplasma helicoides TaxID=216938 RepID=A0A1B3SK43_9MOLU|nr:hypothetical protein [Spiroplasma helicoides]AOG60301.1 hypothetical protein SHELI_v1c03460 [Spiroplasma helicoides]
MKKLLIVLSAVGLTATLSTPLVSCGNTNSRYSWVPEEYFPVYEVFRLFDNQTIYLKSFDKDAVNQFVDDVIKNYDVKFVKEPEVTLNEYTKKVNIVFLTNATGEKLECNFFVNISEDVDSYLKKFSENYSDLGAIDFYDIKNLLRTLNDKYNLSKDVFEDWFSKEVISNNDYNYPIGLNLNFDKFFDSPVNQQKYFKNKYFCKFYGVAKFSFVPDRTIDMLVDSDLNNVGYDVTTSEIFSYYSQKENYKITYDKYNINSDNFRIEYDRSTDSLEISYIRFYGSYKVVNVSKNQKYDLNQINNQTIHNDNGIIGDNAKVWKEQIISLISKKFSVTNNVIDDELNIEIDESLQRYSIKPKNQSDFLRKFKNSAEGILTGPQDVNKVINTKYLGILPKSYVMRGNTYNEAALSNVISELNNYDFSLCKLSVINGNVPALESGKILIDFDAVNRNNKENYVVGQSEFTFTLTSDDHGKAFEQKSYTYNFENQDISQTIGLDLANMSYLIEYSEGSDKKYSWFNVNNNQQKEVDFKKDLNIQDATLYKVLKLKENQVLVASSSGLYKVDFDTNGAISTFVPISFGEAKAPSSFKNITDAQLGLFERRLVINNAGVLYLFDNETNLYIRTISKSNKFVQNFQASDYGMVFSNSDNSVYYASYENAALVIEIKIKNPNFVANEKFKFFMTQDNVYIFTKNSILLNNWGLYIFEIKNFFATEIFVNTSLSYSSSIDQIVMDNNKNIIVTASGKDKNDKNQIYSLQVRQNNSDVYPYKYKAYCTIITGSIVTTNEIDDKFNYIGSINYYKQSDYYIKSFYYHKVEKGIKIYTLEKIYQNFN